ncbi:MAG: hypothetical protein J7497_10805, partial [Chitinophagaceae bacterium]|nr:hypothetical protein [Chitinophagaceae bacterium]
RIKHHTLYHYYSIYLANKKLAGKEYQGFEEWSVKQKKSLKLNVSAASVFMKLRIKQAVRRFL